MKLGRSSGPSCPYFHDQSPVEPETFKTVGDQDGPGVSVFVMFEYSKVDNGTAFNRNDITWSQVFWEKPDGTIEMVVDDETA